MKKLLLLLLVSFPALLFAQTGPHVTQINTIENIAALKSLSPSTSGVYCVVRGYYASSDGGGGTFYWDATSTETENDGTVIIPTGHLGAGRWLRDCNRNVINVRHFGAVGDCVISEVAYNASTHSGGEVSSYTGLIHEFSGTDDSAAFQRAHAAVDSGKTFYIPAGNYYLNGNASGWSNTADENRPGMEFVEKQDISIMGDGESSRLCISYDCSEGDTVASNTFVLFNFQDSQRCSVKNLHIDLQCIGWSPAQASLDDGDTRLVGGIWAHSLVDSCEDIQIEACKIRVNHPWGSYFGDQYAAGKYSTKLIAIHFSGLFAAPSSVTSEFAAGAVPTKDCSVKNCTFYNGQPYTIFLWMTDRIAISGNKFLGSGGQLPIIRAPHLNNKSSITDNFFEIIPRFSDGGSSYGITYFGNNGDYISKDILVDGNTFLVVGPNSIAPILFTVGKNIKIGNNQIIGSGTITAPGIQCSSNGAYWSVIGDKEEVTSALIYSNTIDGMGNGVRIDSVDSTLHGNTIRNVASYGAVITPRSSTMVNSNTITGADTGIAIQRAGTTASGSAIVSDNVVKFCTTGIAPTTSPGCFDLYHDNVIRFCTTGISNMAVVYHRIYNVYCEYNGTDLGDAGTISVASGSQSVGNGTLYGNPDTRYNP